jgi:hypothetical protein
MRPMVCCTIDGAKAFRDNYLDPANSLAVNPLNLHLQLTV